MKLTSNSTGTFGILVATLASVITLASCTSSSATETTIDTTSTALNTVTIGQKGYETSGQKDGQIFQRAIDVVNQKGGGQVIVPAGQYQIFNVDLKSGVHVMFEPGVTLVPGNGRGANLFNCGNSGSAVSDVALVGPAERFTVDFTGDNVTPEVTKLRVIGVGDCDGFRFENFNVIDNYTVFSSLIFGWDGHSGERAKHGRNGNVENITATNAHYGYGAIQAHSGENIIFRNIKSVGGVAVRLETGLIPMNKAQVGGLNDILVEGAYSQSGQAALMFQPHTMQHGSIVAQNIVSDGSEYAVSIAAPFVSRTRYTSEDNLKPGKYDSLIIDNVKSTYTDGPIITRYTHLKYYPEALHPMITRVAGAISQPELRGPSIAAVSMQDTLSQNISITNVEAIGFKHHPDVISKDDIFAGNWKKLGGPRLSPKKNKKTMKKKGKWNKDKWNKNKRHPTSDEFKTKRACTEANLPCPPHR
ncbi:glycoside hydrolase family protein [Robiginitomaculum antarcticum]|uniref:hypothetical protein n=1 Tax=Robiginitomaculum antarcticum TaxID=437507 RepID=UPI00036C3232|nr:hypothetical protein [Robiginitomaculum antarcticum]